MNSMRLIYGTGNPAKIASMREILKDLPLSVDGLPEGAPDVPEDGVTPLQNARQKAEAYYRAFQQPVFSCDSGLYLKNVPDAVQPAVHARRPQGSALSDEEMILYYAGLARKYGDGRLTAYYRNAICLILDDNTCIGYDGDDICSGEFLLSDKPHPIRTPGWPLDSLSLSARTGEYWFDMDREAARQFEKDIAPGFRHFFCRALGISPDTICFGEKRQRG